MEHFKRSKENHKSKPLVCFGKFALAYNIEIQFHRKCSFKHKERDKS